MTTLPHPVSVIIPTYNRRDTVCRAVESVLSQTCGPYEIVVVDDGSSDGTPEELSARFGPAIRCVCQHHAGASAARNRGIKESRHNIVAFLDSDDRWYPCKLEKQAPLMDREDVVLSFTDVIHDRTARQTSYFADIGLHFRTNPALIEDPLSLLARRQGTTGIWTSTCICRKSALLRVGCFDEGKRIFEDAVTWFRLGFQGKFAVRSEVLTVNGWGLNEKNLSNLGSSQEYLEAATNRLQIYRETYQNAAGAPPQVQRDLRFLIGRALVSQMKYFAQSGSFAPARRNALDAMRYGIGSKVALQAMIGVIAPAAYRTYAKLKTPRL